MSVEGLKEQARRHEQREEWQQALDLYRRAIGRLEEEDQPDVSLYNRVGDLCVRMTNLDQALDHYEQAVELYVEAELPNNAIAVCKKIIRNVPGRSPVYLRMGRIRAQQGFLTDARQNFLTYAELVQAEGEMDEALRALRELADLTPDDADLRVSLAEQLRAHDRSEDALDQLRAAYATLVSQGEIDRAEALEAMARDIDPTADLAAAVTAWSEAEASAAYEPDAVGGEFGEIMVGAGEPQDEAEVDDAYEAEPMEGLEDSWSSIAFEEGEDEEDEGEVATFSEEDAQALPIYADDEHEEGALEELPTFGHEEEEGEALPYLADDEVEDPDEAALELPTGQFQGEDEAGEVAGVGDSDEEEVLTAEAFGESERDERAADGLGEELPEVEVSLSLESEDEEAEWTDEDDEDEAAAALEGLTEEVVHEERVTEADTAEGLIAEGDLDGALQLLGDLMEAEPNELAHRKLLVEIAYRRGDPAAQAAAYFELALCLVRNGSRAEATGVYRQILKLDPHHAGALAALGETSEAGRPAASVASSEDYVDLGSLILGDDDDQKTTRFRIAYEEPSGDEQADFSRMLSQFKAKIAENVDAGDVQAHHDLGTAYKEMGLLDEAIEEFQAALKASRAHLPTYELLGQCFIEKGQHQAAVKSLSRALHLPVSVEDELLGIYYYLGRAHEATGDAKAAVDFYDRVFSLDINFMDVTERLRALR